MMFEDVIRERTATRSFKDKKVEKEKIIWSISQLYL